MPAALVRRGRARVVAPALATSLLVAAPAAANPAPDDEPALDPEAEVIVVEAEAPAEAASSVHFDAEDLRRRPRTEPSDVLRQVPGLVVAQHAGGGKADQYFLRGFDADHGTDVAIFVDGVPVNLTSHGHGHGYADAHWIIPETIATLDVHKGPYAARYGDFATAGVIELRTIEDLGGAVGVEARAQTGVELGGAVALERPSYRLVGLAAPRLGRARALVAAEAGYVDGPFLHEQDFRRAALLAKLRVPVGRGELALDATAYAADWNQSGQLPAAEIAAGRLDRFGSLDPTEGGASARASLSAAWSAPLAGGQLRVHGYSVAYRLDLFSNFTLWARDTTHGDQIEQTDDRVLGGAAATYVRAHAVAGAPGLVHAGVTARADAARVSLWHAEARARLPDCFGVANPCNDTDNRIVNLAAFVEEDLRVRPWLQVTVGARVDQYLWRVDDRDPDTAGTMATTAGDAARAIVSPKLTAIVHASADLDVYASAGLGFHSNDARAAVAADGVGALPRARGAEVGMRVHPGARLRAAWAAWYLHLASEQVWSGDNGGTEPSDPTRRYGLDLDLALDVTPWLALDANLALARSTFVANAGNGGALALAPRLMGGGGVTLRRGPHLAAVRVRGVDDRPANDDGTLTAEGFVLIDLVASWRRGPLELGATVENLLDADWREAQFAEDSRVSPMAEVRQDVHFTPGAPLTAFVTAAYTY
jgi:outer membrane receptor protein involved in Fe transport